MDAVSRLAMALHETSAVWYICTATPFPCVKVKLFCLCYTQPCLCFPQQQSAAQTKLFDIWKEHINNFAARRPILPRRDSCGETMLRTDLSEGAYCRSRRYDWSAARELLVSSPDLPMDVTAGMQLGRRLKSLSASTPQTPSTFSSCLSLSL